MATKQSQKVARRSAAKPRRSTGSRAAAASPSTARTGSAPPPAPAARVRLARVAKGRKPQYFADPAVDKLLAITMTLAAELSVTRDRLDTVERLLAKRRVLALDDIESFEPDPAAEAQRETRRQAYLERVLRAVQGELEELTRRDMPASSEDVVAAVAS